MDGGISYSFSQEEQTNAVRACRNFRQLSREGPTYISFIVKLADHRAAVLIVIRPYSHPQFRRQLIFSPHYQYTLCCRSSSTKDTSRRIGQAVQNITGAYFRLGEWDFLDQECYTIDLGLPDRPLGASCTSVANEALRRYISPIEEANGTSEGIGSIRQKNRKRRKTVLSTDKSTAESTSQNSEGSLSGTANDQRQLCENPDQGQTLNDDISKVVRNIEKGLRAVRSRNVGRSVRRNVKDTSLPDGLGHSYMYYAIKLQEEAEEIQQDAQAKKAEVWCARFLSGSISLASSSLPARPAEVFDERNCVLRTISDLGVERLMEIAYGVVEHMRNSVPEINTSQPLLDPALYLSQLMNLDHSVVCEALQLPSLDQQSVSPARYLGALTTTLRPSKSYTEANLLNASDAATRRSEDLQPRTPFEGSDSLIGRNDNNALGDSVDHHVPPQSTNMSIDGALLDQSKPTINIGLDVLKILNYSTNT
ncbi:MAG: hypothetical protein M1840_008022 [Geoglossum simile]|nr:MAG: hypothetical protein M1840_008022 [Geoglossum simile]